jgi:prophage DNA circulation protein
MSTWRDRLVPASFRGAEFKVEQGARAGGRRTVLHEFPKKDTPYAEDMGRRGKRFIVAAYIIGFGLDDYTQARDELIAAMEQEGSGLLIHPTLGEFIVNPGDYSCNESRERGNMAEFELSFVEAGQAPAAAASTQSNVQMKATFAGNQVVTAANSEPFGINGANYPTNAGQSVPASGFGLSGPNFSVLGAGTPIGQ